PARAAWYASRVRPSIAITGVTGHVGRRIAELLVESGLRPRLVARDAARAPALPGCEVSTADYADSKALRAAFDGVERALIVSGYADPMVRARLHANAFAAAAEAGVRHIVYTSFQGSSPTSRFPYGRDHHESEQTLRALGVAYTALRDNLYLDVLPAMFDER